MIGNNWQGLLKLAKLVQEITKKHQLQEQAHAEEKAHIQTEPTRGLVGITSPSPAEVDRPGGEVVEPSYRPISSAGGGS